MANKTMYVSVGIAISAIVIAAISAGIILQQVGKIDSLSDKITQLESQSTKIEGRGSVSQQSISKMISTNTDMPKSAKGTVEERLAVIEKDLGNIKNSLKP